MVKVAAYLQRPRLRFPCADRPLLRLFLGGLVAVDGQGDSHLAARVEVLDLEGGPGEQDAAAVAVEEALPVEGEVALVVETGAARSTRWTRCCAGTAARR